MQQSAGPTLSLARQECSVQGELQNFQFFQNSRSSSLFPARCLWSPAPGHWQPGQDDQSCLFSPQITELCKLLTGLTNCFKLNIDVFFLIFFFYLKVAMLSVLLLRPRGYVKFLSSCPEPERKSWPTGRVNPVCTLSLHSPQCFCFTTQKPISMHFHAGFLMNLNLLPKYFILSSLAGALCLCPRWYLQILSTSAVLWLLLLFP